ncbi:MAG: class I SAM-dependent methyltransferase [Maritimibacter sp.]
MSPIKDVDTYEAKLALIKPYLRNDMRVLEFGCGSGNTARRLAPSVGQYTAMDISPEMIRIGRKEGDVPSNMEMVPGDFDAIDLAPSSIDMIVAMNVVHLVPNPEATIAKVAASLRPGGIFVSSTGTIAHLWFLKALLAPLKAVGKVPEIAFLKPTQVRHWMGNAGMEIVEDPQFSSKSTVFLITRKLA